MTCQTLKRQKDLFSLPIRKINQSSLRFNRKQFTKGRSIGLVTCPRRATSQQLKLSKVTSASLTFKNTPLCLKIMTVVLIYVLQAILLKAMEQPLTRKRKLLSFPEPTIKKSAFGTLIIWLKISVSNRFLVWNTRKDPLRMSAGIPFMLTFSRLSQLTARLQCKLLVFLTKPGLAQQRFVERTLVGTNRRSSFFSFLEQDYCFNIKGKLFFPRNEKTRVFGS